MFDVFFFVVYYLFCRTNDDIDEATGNIDHLLDGAFADKTQYSGIAQS